MASNFKRSYAATRWTGEATEFADIAEYIVGLLGEDDPEVTIDVSQPGVEDEFDDIRVFRDAYGADDLRRAETIVVTVSRPTPKPFVRIAWNRHGDGVRASIRGEDAVLVDGIHQRVVERLRTGERTTLGVWIPRGLALVAAIPVEGFILSHALEGFDTNELLAVSAILAPLALVGGTFAGTQALFPYLEVVGVGEVTRWRRRRNKVLAAGGTIVLAVIVALIERVLF